MTGEIRDENYIVIQGWMATKLHLKGNELLVYDCIYGFSQAEDHVYDGSLSYLSKWTNSSKQNIMKCLNSLVEKGPITELKKEQKRIVRKRF